MLCVFVKMYLFPPLLLTSLNQFYVKIMNMTKLIDVEEMKSCLFHFQKNDTVRQLPCNKEKNYNSVKTELN